ncbi:MAG TPA: bifunctional phosphoribosylaminoimidazolecarboxamide formyltransferase/IMP cyclohydrolase [Chitinivibrionales bacterium]|jgi:phosphoribosylaminoimidazolecarboxamide formyltransferase/IMP cyclohydrolase|nr:bifunctional phosphoribosylaminoimidazolecarboxamide formyltransferase/IMP cyclohydrolase [Chitinivibrionales bacterium]
MSDAIKITRALVSVSDKAGIVDFARALAECGVEIVSTGGTSRLLSENKVPVRTVDSLTGFPEIMDGRVKTLHPKVHGGILGVRDNPSHLEQMQKNGIVPIDLVVVNLYPFRVTIEKPGVTAEEAIENIDIGGPAMIRSAAKNHAYVTVVVDPADYAAVAQTVKNGGVPLDMRKSLAVKAFGHTAEYDGAINVFFSRRYLNEEVLRLCFRSGVELRYGENPHQSAMFFKSKECTEPCMGTAEQLHGKELSYNNIVDGDAAIEAAKELASAPGAAVIKHTNPCGFATGKSLAEALEAAWSGDPVSAYGSVIAVTRPVDLNAAQVLGRRFVEILIAPDFVPDALQYLKDKSSQLRILKTGDLNRKKEERFVYKHVVGAMLRQDRDVVECEKWETVTTAQFPENKAPLARFAWAAAKHTKSNAIVLAQEYAPGNFRVVGMGAGQPNRVDSLRKLSITKARENFTAEKKAGGPDFSEEFSELVLASDAFFPFADNIEEAHKAGIRYIVEPGGSKRDAEVIDACNKYGIAMVFTGTRHFRH